MDVNLGYLYFRKPPNAFFLLYRGVLTPGKEHHFFRVAKCFPSSVEGCNTWERKKCFLPVATCFSSDILMWKGCNSRERESLSSSDPHPETLLFFVVPDIHHLEVWPASLSGTRRFGAAKSSWGKTQRMFCKCWMLFFWLVVWTPLKNISLLGWLFPIYGKIKNVPNHQPVECCSCFGGALNTLFLNPHGGFLK